MSSDHYDEETFSHLGHNFVARFYRDEDHGEPWEENDGHGPVSEWTNRDKRPGEVVLVTDDRGRGFKRFYDWQEAMKIAKRDRWNAPPYDEGTRGQKAARAVQRDFDYLRGWCNDLWHYCGISVTLADENGEFDEAREYEFALWGIERGWADYHKEAMKELADEILPELNASLEAAARELETSRPDMYQASA